MPSRTGVALCLSGGGFRSALFHLGALRRLKELRVLHDVTVVSSVSGGSILAGFFADVLARSRTTRTQEDFATWLDRTDWEAVVAAPFREITARDFRTTPVLKHVLWNWAVPGFRVRDLEDRYHRFVSQLTLGELPMHPRFVFCATNLAFGVNWEFDRGRAGDYQGGYIAEATAWPVARAIAASSCFPPIFGPMPVRVGPEGYKDGNYRGNDRDRLSKRTALTDGGVYDNLGLEPVWKKCAAVLVSDCGAPFDFSVAKTPLRRLMRYTSVVMNQAGSARKRMFFQGRRAGLYEGTYWGIRSSAGKKSEREFAALEETEGDGRDLSQDEDEGLGGYSRELVDTRIAEIRTDLDGFTGAEQKVLENHGYFAANRSVTRYLDRADSMNVPLSIPHPEWLDEVRVKRALEDSHRRVSLSRIWKVRAERRTRAQ